MNLDVPLTSDLVDIEVPLFSWLPVGEVCMDTGRDAGHQPPKYTFTQRVR